MKVNYSVFNSVTGEILYKGTIAGGGAVFQSSLKPTKEEQICVDSFQSIKSKTNNQTHFEINLHLEDKLECFPVCIFSLVPTGLNSCNLLRLNCPSDWTLHFLCCLDWEIKELKHSWWMNNKWNDKSLLNHRAWSSLKSSESPWKPQRGLDGSTACLAALSCTQRPPQASCFSLLWHHPSSPSGSLTSSWKGQFEWLCSALWQTSGRSVQGNFPPPLWQ